MEADHVSIRAGRVWRHNPVYREALLGLCASARHGLPDAQDVEVLDVLSFSVDGVELLAGMREDHVFRSVRDLVRASERLARGAPKASLTLGARPMEVLLVRSGARIRVTVVSFGPPPEIPIRDLEIDATRFFEAVRSCADALLDDLRALNPALARGAFGAALAAGSRRLRGRARADRAEDLALTYEGPTVGPRAEVPRGVSGLSCGFEISDDCDELRSFYEAPQGDLHSLLVPGRVQLHGPAGDALARWEGPPFLALRALVGGVREVLGAWELGESRGRLAFGDHELSLDLQAGCMIGDRRVEGIAPAAVCTAVLHAALDFCAVAVSRAPAQARNAYLADLVTDAQEAADHCRQFAEGDLTAGRGDVAAVRGGGPARAASSRPLTSWRLRRLTFRERWVFDAGPLLPGGLGLLGRRLLAAGDDGAFALDLATGTPSWQREDVRGIWFGPRRAAPVMLATELGVDLVTPSGGTAWSTPPVAPVRPNGDRYLRGAGHILASLDGRSVTAFEEASGRVAWRFAAPGARACRLATAGAGALVATDAGFLYGLDPVDGRVRFRVRTAISPLALPVVTAGTATVLGLGPDGPAAFLAEAATGQGAGTLDLNLDEMADPIAFGGRLFVPGHVAGEAAVALLRPGSVGRVRVPGLQGIPAVLPVRGRTFVADAGGRVCALDGAGEVLWCATLEGSASPGLPRPVLATSRGVLLVGHDAVHTLDPNTGDALGMLTVSGAFGFDHLLVDERLNVYAADREGAVHAGRTGTHLSVVGG